MSSVLPRHAFTVHEWEEMGRLGLFDEDARVELIDGEIVDMTPIGARHQDCVNRLAEQFWSRAGDMVVVQVQGPVRLSEHSEPQPDLAVLRRRPEGYAAALPGPAAVLLVVEVADTTLERDLAKAAVYAASGIRECWIVDLQGDQVIASSEPGPEGYRAQRFVRGDETLEPTVLTGFAMRAAEVLGGRP
ncbi:MAG: Uma2 family endonuclease [Actinomycetota bacterium]|jgi:Uma2 family endonuclease|nr:Uma2 family endonuclease [Actinomycetota bacterium]